MKSVIASSKQDKAFRISELKGIIAEMEAFVTSYFAEQGEWATPNADGIDELQAEIGYHEWCLAKLEA